MKRPPILRRHLRLAAARRDLTVRQYRLELDYTDGPPALTSQTDPVLAELWDNRRDAQYDRLGL